MGCHPILVSRRVVSKMTFSSQISQQMFVSFSSHSISSFIGLSRLTLRNTCLSYSFINLLYPQPEVLFSRPGTRVCLILVSQVSEHPFRRILVASCPISVRDFSCLVWVEFWCAVEEPWIVYAHPTFAALTRASSLSRRFRIGIGNVCCPHAGDGAAFAILHAGMANGLERY